MRTTDFLTACSFGCTETVSFLLEDSEIDVNKGDNGGWTGFLCACEFGYTEIVRLLLQDSRIDINKGDGNGGTGFLCACSHGHTEIVRLLLEHSRIDVNKTGNSGWTGFISACYNRRTEIVRLLLQDSRIDINKADNNGWTGFISACYNRRTEIVRLLLQDSRIDANKGDGNGRTGFMIYFERREMDIASLIVRHSPEMHRKWWEMRVGYLCRQLTSHTFMLFHDELERLLHLWKRLFTYTTIEEESDYPRRSAIIERSRGVWKRELGKERWREGCDVMRENDSTNIFSLFFYCHRYTRWSSNRYNSGACGELKDAFYPRIPYRDIEQAFRIKEEDG